MHERKVSKQIIVYIDILGYKDLLRNMKEDEFLATIDRVIHLSSIITDMDKMESLDKPKLNIFSDNIVLSAELTYNNLLNCVKIIKDIQRELLLRFGIYARGAITIGNFYRTAIYVFGSALVQAYELESSIAIYPRIVISNESLLYAHNVAKMQYPRDLIEATAINDELYNTYVRLHAIGIKTLFSYTSVAEDGVYFIDYISGMDARQLDKHKERLVHSIAEYKDKEKVLTKYRWVVSQHNAECKKRGITEHLIVL